MAAKERVRSSGWHWSRITANIALALLLVAVTGLLSGVRGSDDQVPQHRRKPGQTAELEEIDAPMDEDEMTEQRLRGNGIVKKLDGREFSKEFSALETDSGRLVDSEEYGAAFYVIVEPYSEECFYQPVKSGSVLHVLFNVEANPTIMHPDVDLEVTDPAGNVVLQELHSRGNAQGDHDKRHDNSNHDGSMVMVKKTGDYKVCFNNRQSNSAMYRKQLYLDIGPVLHVKYTTLPDNLDQEIVEKIHETLDTCNDHLDGIMDFQLTQRRHYHHDMSMAVMNESMVVYRSLLIVTLMGLAVLLQTVIIRTFFKTTARV
ncbi:uncharacterized protein LOC135815556 [Sycon ciliatum]|uniref:uncharacterized protein LOC135815556 n=1 Tax=Sycon ciliatum TaxID=27933 RepID=UPI0020ADC24F|eukprot:scpid81572/ scgid28330/ Transmembrane emp24 domain-containing protein B